LLPFLVKYGLKVPFRGFTPYSCSSRQLPFPNQKKQQQQNNSFPVADLFQKLDQRMCVLLLF